MRVLHVPYSFYPDAAGGTEVYVDGLAASQRSLGGEIAIAAPGTPAKYERNGIPIWRFPVSTDLDLRALYGGGDKVAAEAFGQILDDFRPAIVHLHALTSAISIRLGAEAANRGIPIILNYHTPTVSCSRGTLLRWGSTICDGELNHRACTACTLEGHGMARPLASLIASLPINVSRRIGNAELAGGPWTALRMSELIDLRIRSFHRLMQMVDRVVALCDWTRELLIRNGVPEKKIALCRQGISWSAVGLDAAAPLPFSLPLRAAFLGRLDPTKGTDILVKAVKSDSALPIQLDLFGVLQDETSNQFARELLSLIGSDKRIRLLPPITSSDVVARLRSYDVVVVPSQLLETGPLVVLEAFAAGTPVLGSNLGGIAELVQEGVNGLLVTPASSSQVWLDVLRKVCSNPEFLRSLREGIRPPRHTRDVAAEMLASYESLVCDNARQALVPGI